MTTRGLCARRRALDLGFRTLAGLGLLSVFYPGAVLWVRFVGAATVVAWGVLEWKRSSKQNDGWERLKQQLDNPWVLQRGGLEEGPEIVVGTWRRATVRLEHDRLREIIRCAMDLDVDRWPHGLSIEPRSSVGEGVGDQAFDRVAQVFGDEQLWRPLLDHRVRARLVTIFESVKARIADQKVRFETESARVAAAGIDEATALIEVIPSSSADVWSRVFEIATHEPDPAVRFGHFKWLAAYDDSRAPLVYRAAAADADAETTRWGRDSLGPDAGVFR